MTTAPQGAIRVEIVEDHGIYRMVPPVLRVSAGDSVLFVPPQGDTAELFMPVEAVFGVWRYSFDGKNPPLTVQDLEGQPGFELPFAFRIGLYLAEKRTYVEGGSAPKVIVDPPRS